jgi:hypothetical protein
MLPSEVGPHHGRLAEIVAEAAAPNQLKIGR